MAAAVTPERSGVCVEVCNHGGCEGVRALAATRCVLCGELIGYATEILHQAGWRVLAHRRCALADLDRWERLGQETSTP